MESQNVALLIQRPSCSQSNHLESANPVPSGNDFPGYIARKTSRLRFRPLGDGWKE